MSAKSRFPSSHTRSALFLAIAALATAAANAPAQAGGTQADEVNRTKVHFQVSDNCNGTSNLCNVTVTTSPSSRKKYLEIHNLSCRVILFSGSVYTTTIQGDASGHIYEFLEQQNMGTVNTTKVFMARNANRTVVNRDDPVRVQALATGDVKSLLCSVNGEVVHYN